MTGKELFVFDESGKRIGKLVPIEEDLITRHEVMKVLKVSYPTVVRMDHKGILQRVNPPGTRTALYRRTDVEKLLKSERSNDKK